MDNESLSILLETHRRNVTYLQQQAAKFGIANVPLPIRNQISLELEEIDKISGELARKSLKFTQDKITDIQRDAERHARNAEIHLRVGNCESAIKEFSQTIELTPSSELFLARGKVYRQISNTEQAVRDFSTAILTANSRKVEADARIERSLVIGSSFESYNEETWKEDIDWLVINKEESNLGELYFVEAEEIRGNYYMEEPWYPIVITRLLDIAIRFGTKNPDAFFFRAEAYYARKKFNLALKDLEQCLTVASKHWDNKACALDLKAHIALLMRDYESFYKTFMQRLEYNNTTGYDKGLCWTIIPDLPKIILLNATYHYKFMKDSDFKYYQEDIEMLRALEDRIAKDILEISEKHPEIGKVISAILHPPTSDIHKTVVM
jgi:tetratricopeptide (TPR) repeat protein